MKYSIEVDVYFSKTALNKVLRGPFYPLRALQNFSQQYRYLDRQVSQYGSRLHWSRDEFCQSLCRNPGPKPVFFVTYGIFWFRTTTYIYICISVHSSKTI